MKTYVPYLLVLAFICALKFTTHASSTPADSTFEIIASASNATPCLNETVQLSSQVNISPYYNSYSNCGTNGSSCDWGSQEKTFSSGAVIIMSDFSGPFESTNSKYQYIFTAAELQAKGLYSGAFNSLSFDVSVNNISGSINNLSVYMNCTSTSAFSSTSTNSYLPEGDLVYTSSSLSTALGWNVINFDSTFDWDGTSNIVITFCHSGSAFSGGLGIDCTDLNAYRTLGISGSCATASPTYANQFRPNMKLGICNPPIGELSYQWTPSTGLSNDTIANPTFTATSSPISYIVAVTDGVLTRYDTIDIGVGVMPTAVASADATICTGESVQISASGGNSYLWDNGLGSGASHQVSPTSTTTYQVTATATGGCTDTDEVTITVNPLPTTSITSSTDICDGESILISASGGSIYAWDNSLGSGASHTVSPTVTTTYNVTITSSNGCTKDESVTITVNPLPTVSITLDNGTLVATSGYAKYNWFLDGSGIASGSSNSYSTSVLSNGDYEVEVTDANGCKATSETFTYTMESIKELEDAHWIIYPNPASEVVYMDLQIPSGPANATLIIQDPLGRTIAQQKLNVLNQQAVLDVREYPKGLYYLKLVTSKGIITRKLKIE